jgi:hypothetical protein
MYVCMYVSMCGGSYLERNPFVMYICMYVCMYVYMYVCMSVCAAAILNGIPASYIYVCMYACMYLYVCICTYSYVYTCMYLCGRACVFVCMCASHVSVCLLYVCNYVCRYVCIYVYVRAYLCVCEPQFGTKSCTLCTYNSKQFPQKPCLHARICTETDRQMDI